MKVLTETDSCAPLFRKAADVLESYGWTNKTDTFHPLSMDEPRNLLMALQEACDYSLTKYKQCIEGLCHKLGIEIEDPDKRWPVLALNVVEWENSKARTKQDVDKLLLG